MITLKDAKYIEEIKEDAMFANLNKRSKAETAIGVLLAAGLLSGCSNDRLGSQAIDSRSKVDPGDNTFSELSLPNYAKHRTLLQIQNSQLSRVSLAGDKSYVIEVPSRHFTELQHLAVRRMGRFETDDTIVFQVSSDDISRYEVFLDTYRYCSRGGFGEMDGTYVLLTDRSNGNRIESGVKLGFYGALRVKSQETSVPNKTKPSLVFLKTPDDILHQVSPLKQYFNAESHVIPSYVEWVNSKISPVVNASELQGP